MIDPWPDEQEMAERCGCGHTLGQHEYGDDSAPCEHCPCRDFHGPGTCKYRVGWDVCPNPYDPHAIGT